MPADHVICTWCDAESYIPVGEEICPNCKKEGCLAWFDYEEQEVDDADEFKIISIGGVLCNQ